MKRVLDLLIIAATAPLWLPLIATVAIVSLAVSGRPVFFTQERAGLAGRIFKIIKFRTMTPGDEPDAQRMTGFGKFLRVSSLDELPEILNVIRGDMSLVGPRPLPARYLSRYSKWQNRRHEVRPGITGWAQVNGRNSLDWNEKFLRDIEYVDNRSTFLDLKIIAMTVCQVLFARGISHEGEATMTEFSGCEE